MPVTVIGNKLKVEVLADESTKTQLNEIQREVGDLDKRVADLDSRVDTIITTPAESVSAQEIIDARDGHTVLGDRLDFEKDQQQRNAQNISERSAYNSHFVQNVRPLVTLIDDDGDDRVLTDLKDIAVEYGIKFGIALYNTSSIIVDPVKREETLRLQNEHGWEILSHSMNHTWYGDMTPEQIEDDCKESIKTFNGYGFNVFNLVYPFSLPNNTTAKIVSKYYSAAFGTGANYSTISNINEYNIYRIGIGSYSNKTLQEYKDIIDEVIDNNGWLVLMTHIGKTNAEGMQLIRDVLDYVVSNNIEIVTPQEGLRVFGSVSQSGLKDENYFHIKSDGIVKTNTYVMINRKSKLESDPATVTEGTYNVDMFRASGWSLGKGIVIEYYASNGYQYQEFRKTGTRPETYVRKWSGSSWGVWYRNALVLDNLTVTVTARTVSANSCDTITFYDATALSSHAYIAQPTGQLEDGITWNCWSYGDGAYRLRICNNTNTDISLIERVWKIHRIFA